MKIFQTGFVTVCILIVRALVKDLISVDFKERLFSKLDNSRSFPYLLGLVSFSLVSSFNITSIINTKGILVEMW